MKLLLDSNVIGKICHPTKHQDVRVWFGAAVREHEVLLPEVGTTSCGASYSGSARGGACAAWMS